MSSREHIYPEFDHMLGRVDKEAQLGQRAHVFWFYGRSGSGKSTLVNLLERQLRAAGIVTKLLDGDNIRSRLNADLGFSDADRAENIRRIAEVARLFLDAGVVVLTSFITPLQSLRTLAASKVGTQDFTPIYVNASYATCADRDVKGLYAKAAAGQVQQFTGKDSAFEEPTSDAADWIVDTEAHSAQASAQTVYQKMLPIIRADRTSD